MKKNLIAFFSIILLLIYLINIETILAPILSNESENPKSFLNLIMLVAIFFPYVVLLDNISAKFTKYLLIFLTTIIFFVNFINVGHLLYVKSALNSVSLATILDTNIAETKEFTESLLDIRLLYLFLLLLPSFFLAIFHKPFIIKSKKVRVVLYILSLAASIYTLPKLWVHREILSVEFCKTYLDVRKDRMLFVEMISKKAQLPQIFDNISSSLTSDNHTFVIIIGESASRKHMSIYGYERQTTPNFDRIKDELYIFDNVTSSDVTTVGSLEKVLTFATIEDVESDLRYRDIIEFFKKANFKTYWLSNQAFTFNSKYDAITELSDNRTFLSKGDKAIKNNNYDGLLIPLFQEILNDKAKNKLIFLQLGGSHVTYTYRYPKKFEKFEVPIVGEDRVKSINSYDNSIYYTDYVLNELLNKLRVDNSTSYMLYFPDHGEDSYDFTDQFRIPRNTTYPTPTMYEIPFVLWLSPKYKESYPEFIANIGSIDNLTKRAYQTDKVIHSIIELSQLDHGLVRKDYSIFSKFYKRFPRKIHSIQID